MNIKQTLAARAAFYINDEDLKDFNPNEFDEIRGQVLIRAIGADDLAINFSMRGSGNISFLGPTYPEGTEGMFIRCFMDAMARMWSERGD